MIQHAVMLNSRAYRENSQLVDLFCESSGMVRALYRKNARQPALQMGELYEIKLSLGQGELYFIQQAEVLQCYPPLHGRQLYLAFYINELTIKLVKNISDSRYLLQSYLVTYQALSNALQPAEEEALLRRYELIIIEELGVKPDFEHTADCHSELVDNKVYQLDYQAGWFECEDPNDPKGLPGNVIRRINKADFGQPTTLKYAKKLMRGWIDHLLGSQTLNSRQLFKRADS